MSTLGQPVPPRPDAFTADGVPPGITWNPLPVDRPALDEPARLVLIHTNSGPNRSTMGGQRSWAMAAADNTKPTYQIGLDQDDGAEKWLRSDQRSIANGTVVPGMSDWDNLTAEQQASINEHGRSATFSLSVETLDLGSNNGLGDFTDYQGERIARLLAYESMVPGNQIVLTKATAWFSAGVGGHTDPFEYPYWTIYRGKTCPGTQKKASLWGWVLPRAIEIHTAWTEGDLASSDEIMAELQATKLIAQAALEEAKAGHVEAAAAHSRIDRFADNEFSRDMATSKRDWERFAKLVAKLEALVPKS